MEKLQEAKFEIDHGMGYWRINVPNLTGKEFEAFCYAFGELVPAGWAEKSTSELIFDYSEGFNEIPLHTDKSYWSVPPKYIVFYYEKLDGVTGGEQTFCNIETAFSEASTETKDALSEIITFQAPKNRIAKIDQYPIRNTLNNLSFFRVREDVIQGGMPVIQEFFSNLDRRKFAVNTHEGDLIIANNWRMAHGRNTTFLEKPESQRFMRRGLIL